MTKPLKTDGWVIVNPYDMVWHRGIFDTEATQSQILHAVLAAIEALTPIASGSGVVPVGPIEVGDVMPTNMREILDEQLARAKSEGRTLPDPASTGKDKEPT